METDYVNLLMLQLHSLPVAEWVIDPRIGLPIDRRLALDLRRVHAALRSFATRTGW